MASTTLMTTKDGRRFFKISVSRGHGKTPYTKRWYWPDGWSKRAAERELNKVAAEFELQCEKGEVLNREELKSKAAEEAAEAAKLKTVRQYGDGVFMATKEASFSANARSSYRQFLDKHIYPTLGNVLLTEVTPAMVTKLLVDFQKRGYAHATCVKLYNILNGLFDMAFMDDSIPLSPMLKVKRPAPRKDEAQKPESEKALTAEQLGYVLSCAQSEPLKWYAYLVLSADSWARRGELCALQWSDVDFKARTITIRRNLQYTVADGVFETTPKNGKSRVVDIGEETLKILGNWRRQQARDGLSPYVFTQDSSLERMHPQSPTRYFSNFSKRYNVENFHPHTLRHTGASIALTNGADVASVSERLGHSDKAVTLRMYTHANPESIRKAGQTVRDLLKVGNE